MNTIIETPHIDAEAASTEDEHGSLRLWLRLLS